MPIPWYFHPGALGQNDSDLHHIERIFGNESTAPHASRHHQHGLIPRYPISLSQRGATQPGWGVYWYNAILGGIIDLRVLSWV